MTDNERELFISEMTHAVRNPMGIIMGNCNLIESEPVSLKVKEYAGGIKKASARLVDVINDSLDIIRISEGKLNLNQSTYYISNVLGELSSFIDSYTIPRHIHVSYDIDRSVPNRLYGDERRVAQMLKRAVLNEILHIESGELHINLRHEKAGDMSVRIILEFIPEGTRLSDFESERILVDEKIEYVSGFSHIVEGTGIIGILAKGLAGLMEGSYESDADYGGTVVSFVQEVLGCENLEDSENTGKQSAASDGAVFAVDGANALIVDRNSITLKVEYYLLKKFGLEADLAESTEDMLSLMKTKAYDIIFTDLETLGDETPLEGLVRENPDFPEDANEHYRGIPVIAISKHPLTAEQLEKTGYNDFLIKSMENNELTRVLENWIPDEYLRYETQIESRMKDKRHALIQLGINYDEALEALEGNKEEYYRILLNFTKNCEDNILSVITSFKMKDRNNYLISIRGLLGVMQTIGAGKLAEMIRNIEDTCVSNNLSILKNETDEVIEACRRLLDALTSLFQHDEAPVNQEDCTNITNAELVRLLKLLAYEISEYHVEEANQLFYELAQKHVEDESILEKIHEIESDFLDSFKYNEVVAAIEEIIAGCEQYTEGNEEWQ